MVFMAMLLWRSLSLHSGHYGYLPLSLSLPRHLLLDLWQCLSWGEGDVFLTRWKVADVSPSTESTPTHPSGGGSKLSLARVFARTLHLKTQTYHETFQRFFPHPWIEACTYNSFSIRGPISCLLQSRESAPKRTSILLLLERKTSASVTDWGEVCVGGWHNDYVSDNTTNLYWRTL